ncbi:catalase-related domain-containing protein [Peptococcus simiae]
MQEADGAIGHYDFREDDSDYFTQPGMLFRAMTPDQQQVLFENTARNMGDSTLQIKHRWINYCYQADPAYGQGVADALGIDLADVDLNLPARDSREGNDAANQAHPELDQPTKGKPTEDHEIDTNGPDYIDPEDDPWLL